MAALPRAPRDAVDSTHGAWQLAVRARLRLRGHHHRLRRGQHSGLADDHPLKLRARRAHEHRATGPRRASARRARTTATACGCAHAAPGRARALHPADTGAARTAPTARRGMADQPARRTARAACAARLGGAQGHALLDHLREPRSPAGALTSRRIDCASWATPRTTHPGNCSRFATRRRLGASSFVSRGR